MLLLKREMTLHLSLRKNFLLIQFEGGTNLPPHCGWLLSWVKRIFFRKLSCQFLQKAKRKLYRLTEKGKTYCDFQDTFLLKLCVYSHTASLMQMLLSSSILCLSVSSSASCLALSAASMSFLAVWELSDSWEPEGYRQHIKWGQESGLWLCVWSCEGGRTCECTC